MDFLLVSLPEWVPSSAAFVHQIVGLVGFLGGVGCLGVLVFGILEGDTAYPVDSPDPTIGLFTNASGRALAKVFLIGLACTGPLAFFGLYGLVVELILVPTLVLIFLPKLKSLIAAL